MVSSAKEVAFGGCTCRVASFCVAGVAFRDIQANCHVSKVVLSGRRNTFAMFSEDALQFSWQAQHFTRVVLRVFASRIVRVASTN